MTLASEVFSAAQSTDAMFDFYPIAAPMSKPPPSAERFLELAILHVNAGQAERAMVLCELAVQAHPAHPALHQLLAQLQFDTGRLDAAAAHIATSLAGRADHVPSLYLAGVVARAQGRLADAAQALSHAAQLAPTHDKVWFELALVRQDVRDFEGAVDALQHLLRIAPPRAEIEVNLGILLQETGRMDDAMQAYGRAYRLRADTFGRIAHALATPGHGRLWLNLDDLHAALRGQPA